jgi:putative Flp pilus-assembly TadE/G-like protein
MKPSRSGSCDTPRRQRGAVLVMFALAMAVMLGLVGLALDGGHGMLNKTRLQNVVDAAALSAAKTLDQTGDQVLATAEALQTFSTNSSGLGNSEMADSYAGGDLDVDVQFSNTLHPFAAGTVPPLYVRVRASNFRLPGWFIPVFGFDEKIVGASAVAGPSPTIQTGCNLAPMMVCGDPNAPPEDNFGYELGEADVLKSSTNSFEVGPGNFQLIRLGGGQGGAVIRTAMAGNYAGCVTTGNTVPTEPGNTVGPVVQGLNTRFGQYLGPMGGTQSQYPPDVVVGEPIPPLTYDTDTDTIFYNSQPLDGDPDPDYYDHDDYLAEIQSGAYDFVPLEEGGIGAFGRRTLAVPVGDCTETTNGQGDVPVLGFLCYHLLQKAQQKGNESQVYGQFIEEGCQITGRPGPAPGTGPGPYIIQLYKDEAQEAS